MAVNHKLGLIIVAAALAVVTVGCGSSSSSNGQPGVPDAAMSEATGKPKNIPATTQSGRPLTGAERGAIMSAKGGGGKDSGEP